MSSLGLVWFHRVLARVFPALFLVFTALTASSAGAASPTHEALLDLMRVHDLKTSVALGDRYLKQQALVATRDVLTKIGRERELGKVWARGNVHYDAAENAIVSRLLEPVRDQAWHSLGWLPAPWLEMAGESFSREEVGVLLAHFASDVGRKQARIIDHSVAFHVAGAYGLSGRLIQDYPGTESEQKTLTYVWDDEDREMRFSIAASENIEGQRFALSPLGAKYQKTLVLRLTGIIVGQIDRTAAAFPAQARALASLADVYVTNFNAAAR